MAPELYVDDPILPMKDAGTYLRDRWERMATERDEQMDKEGGE